MLSTFLWNVALARTVDEAVAAAERSLNPPLAGA
jgi:hypothetical protein